ncbi:MAG: enoyl-CoA hydratase [Candidatus Rokubacteria bacterium]|nr:enoyl-CoA hydratase [Candidatus Rokubacteria bacterium]
MDRPLEVEHEDGIVTARLNRPQALNAISSAMAEALCSLLEDVAGRRDARVLVLTGAGERAFSAGAPSCGPTAGRSTAYAICWSCSRSPSFARYAATASAGASSWRWQRTSGWPPRDRSSAFPR